MANLEPICGQICVFTTHRILYRKISRLCLCRDLSLFAFVWLIAFFVLFRAELTRIGIRRKWEEIWRYAKNVSNIHLNSVYAFHIVQFVQTGVVWYRNGDCYADVNERK